MLLTKNSPKLDITYWESLRRSGTAIVRFGSQLWRLLCCLSLFTFLAITLYGLRTRLESSLFHRWTGSIYNWLSLRKRSYITLVTLHGHHSWVESVFSSLLATIGYYWSGRFAWLLLMPWLAKVTVYWILRVLSLAEMYTQVAQAENAGQLFGFLVFVNVMNAVVLVEVAQCGWQLFRRMLQMESEASEFARWKADVERLLMDCEEDGLGNSAVSQ